MSPRPSAHLYLLDGSCQLALHLQTEALDVPNEEFSVLTLWADGGGRVGRGAGGKWGDRRVN